MNDKIPFGKYRGKTIGWVLANDPKYIEWVVKKSNSMTKTKRAAQSAIDKEKSK